MYLKFQALQLLVDYFQEEIKNKVDCSQPQVLSQHYFQSQINLLDHHFYLEPVTNKNKRNQFHQDYSAVQHLQLHLVNHHKELNSKKDPNNKDKFQNSA
jgi:hypothetical protein